jgi:hypothetical protein
VIIITDLIRIYPPELYEKGMAVITSSIIRNHPNALSPKIKSLNYLNNILAKIEAIDAGVLEAIMFNHLGFVAECTADNFFLIRDGVIYTPSASDGSLEGVTAAAIRQLAAKLSIPLHEKHIDRRRMLPHRHRRRSDAGDIDRQTHHWQRRMRADHEAADRRLPQARPRRFALADSEAHRIRFSEGTRIDTNPHK